MRAVRVFLVEDMKRSQELVRELLDFIGGFELVGVATSETSATEWLLRHPDGWDLVILDLMLLEGSGFTLISRCHEGAGKVLVFSDFAGPAVMKRCLRLGADAVISKANFRELRAFLETVRGQTSEAELA